MRSTLGESVVAEVDHQVAVGLQVAAQRPRRVERDVGRDRPEPIGGDRHRLVAQGASGEQTAQASVAAGAPGRRQPRLRLGPAATGGSNGLRGHVAEIRLAAAEQRELHGGAQRLGIRPDRVGHHLGRRLGHEDDELGRLVGVEDRKRLPGRPSADCVGEVAPAHAEAVTDADAGAVEQTHHLLGAGARGSDDAYRPRAQDIGEPQPDTADRSGAAVGTHHQKPAAGALVLEPDLLLDRHVVAEQHDGYARFERIHRLGEGVLTGVEISARPTDSPMRRTAEPVVRAGAAPAP